MNSRQSRAGRQNAPSPCCEICLMTNSNNTCGAPTIYRPTLHHQFQPQGNLRSRDGPSLADRRTAAWQATVTFGLRAGWRDRLGTADIPAAARLAEHLMAGLGHRNGIFQLDEAAP